MEAINYSAPNDFLLYEVLGVAVEIVFSLFPFIFFLVGGDTFLWNNLYPVQTQIVFLLVYLVTSW